MRWFSLMERDIWNRYSGFNSMESVPNLFSFYILDPSIKNHKTQYLNLRRSRSPFSTQLLKTIVYTYIHKHAEILLTLHFTYLSTFLHKHIQIIETQYLKLRRSLAPFSAQLLKTIVYAYVHEYAEILPTLHFTFLSTLLHKHIHECRSRQTVILPERVRGVCNIPTLKGPTQ